MKKETISDLTTEKTELKREIGAFGGVRMIGGKELASTSYAFGTLLRKGVHLSYGTDCPADGFYPGECVDVETAVDAYTLESAYAEFQEDVKGRIKPGYYADMVLL